ncbi:MAG: DUF2262 domain-containing protein [Spirochaetales bacterium]|nr:DUF2262 domain-containing protein [Spirochaetales bacterium]
MGNITLDYKGWEIFILEGDYCENGKPTEEAEKLYTGLIESRDTLKVYAASRLLDLYNETWIDDEIGKLDEAGFMNRLVNPSMTLYNEAGCAVVYFNDSDMFAGHYIEISIEDGKPVNAGLAG